MKIYLLGMFEDPSVDEVMAMEIQYASFAGVGTWEDVGEDCDVCGFIAETRVEPMLVQWEPSSTEIGDFSWDGPFGYECLATDAVRQLFVSHEFECEFLNVEYVEPERAHATVPFPYSAPKQWWLNSTAVIDLDIERSGVKLKSRCDTCGRSDYDFRYDDIVVDRDGWQGEKIFRFTTNERSAATFVSEEGRRLIEEAGLTNVAFTEAGVIVE